VRGATPDLSTAQGVALTVVEAALMVLEALGLSE
jgi:hypothetical protein